MIYMDYQASTPIDPRVLEKINHVYTQGFGNASSTTHAFGDIANAAVKRATHQVASLVGGYYRNRKHHPIVFTSGTTESINLAIKGYVAANPAKQGVFRLATLPLEHKAVLDTCKDLRAKRQIELIFLKVKTNGQIDLDELKAQCQKGLDLLVVMAANNEIGTIYPLQRICEIATEFNTPVFTDASQAAGRIPLAFNEWNIAMLALTGHKMYGPMGVGALMLRKDIRLESMIHGGGHQQGLRSGTLNVPGIVGLGEACALREQEMALDEFHIANMRDLMQLTLQTAYPEIRVNSDLENRLAGNLHISVIGIQNDVLIANIRHELAISTGSACTSGVEEPSHVLTAIGLSEDYKKSALRISLGKFTTMEEIESATKLLINTIQKLKSMKT